MRAHLRALLSSGLNSYKLGNGHIAVEYNDSFASLNFFEQTR